MPRKQGKETDVYQAVANGDLLIDEEGLIWRVSKRGWDRWKGMVVSRPCKRVRAEHDSGEYLQVQIRINGKTHSCQASRLVYLHFYGLIPPLLTVNHKDGKKKRNHPENLELATDSEQALHALHVLNVGRMDQNGAKNAMAKFTPEAIAEIRAMKTEIQAEMGSRHGHKISTLAKKYGVSYSAVWSILKDEHWI
jgi:hypothetical protein